MRQPSAGLLCSDLENYTVVTAAWNVAESQIFAGLGVCVVNTVRDSNSELAPSLPSIPDRAIAGDLLPPSLTSRPSAERSQDGVEHAVEVLANVLGQEAQDESTHPGKAALCAGEV